MSMEVMPSLGWKDKTRRVKLLRVAQQTVLKMMTALTSSTVPKCPKGQEKWMITEFFP